MAAALTPAVEVRAGASLNRAQLAAVAALVPPGHSVTFRIGNVSIGAATVAAAGIFRIFLPANVASVSAVWQAIAGGALGLSHATAARLHTPLGAPVPVAPADGGAAIELGLDALVTTARPIIGDVTCNILMFPQLRGALDEIVHDGLAGAIHPAEYGGCYVPKFIEGSPDHAISLHTWGIAIDLNVAENQRGRKGAMDPRAVAIFKRWGFRWAASGSGPTPCTSKLAALEAPTG